MRSGWPGTAVARQGARAAHHQQLPLAQTQSHRTTGQPPPQRPPSKPTPSPLTPGRATAAAGSGEGGSLPRVPPALRRGRPCRKARGRGSSAGPDGDFLSLCAAPEATPEAELIPPHRAQHRELLRGGRWDGAARLHAAKARGFCPEFGSPARSGTEAGCAAQPEGLPRPRGWEQSGSPVQLGAAWKAALVLAFTLKAALSRPPAGESSYTCTATLQGSVGTPSHVSYVTPRVPHGGQGSARDANQPGWPRCSLCPGTAQSRSEREAGAAAAPTTPAPRTNR